MGSELVSKIVDKFSNFSLVKEITPILVNVSEKATDLTESVLGSWSIFKLPSKLKPLKDLISFGKDCVANKSKSITPQDITDHSIDDVVEVTALSSITRSMTKKIFDHYGTQDSGLFGKVSLASLTATSVGHMVGTQLAIASDCLLPGAGNLVEASITWGLHQATGHLLRGFCEKAKKSDWLDSGSGGGFHGGSGSGFGGGSGGDSGGDSGGGRQFGPAAALVHYGFNEEYSTIMDTLPWRVRAISNKVYRLLEKRPDVVDALQNSQNNPVEIMAKALKENKSFGDKKVISEDEAAPILQLYNEAVRGFDVTNEKMVARVLTEELQKNISSEDLQYIDCKNPPNIVEQIVWDKIHRKEQEELEYQKRMQAKQRAAEENEEQAPSQRRRILGLGLR